VDEVLRKAGLFQGVDPEDAEALAEQFEIFEAPRGTILFHEGEPGDSLYIVLGGKVKLGRRSSDGRENLVAIMGPADQFGDPGVDLGQPLLERLPRGRGDHAALHRPHPRALGGCLQGPRPPVPAAAPDRAAARLHGGTGTPAAPE